MILSWAVSVSMKHLELRCGTMLCLCPGTGPWAHKCSAAAWGDRAVLPPTPSWGNPNSPGFFPRNTTLCSVGHSTPEIISLNMWFLFNPCSYTWTRGIFWFFPVSFQRYIKMLWMIIVRSLSASCMLYAGYFCQRYSNADQAAGCNCSVYPWCRHEQQK